MLGRVGIALSERNWVTKNKSGNVNIGMTRLGAVIGHWSAFWASCYYMMFF